MNKFIKLKNKYGWKYSICAIPIYILSKIDNLFNSNESIQIRNVNNYEMYLNSKKKGLNKELIFNGIRERNNTKAFENEIKKDDIVLDLGANEGYFALLEATKTKNIIYAVEPIMENFKSLNRNIKLNKFENINTFKLALGDKNGFVEMKIGDKLNCCSASDKTYFNVQKIENVQMMTVDTFLINKRTPNIIRMDVEGYEYNILEGMTETLKKIDKILMEMHFQFLTEEQIKEMFNKLKNHGFKIKKIMFDIDIGANNKILNNLIKYFAELRSPIKDGTYEMTYEDILNHKGIMRGSASCPNILFERKILNDNNNNS